MMTSAPGERAERVLYLTSESGRLIRLDPTTGEYRTIYCNPEGGYLFGIACHGETLYIGASTFVAKGRMSDRGFEVIKTVTPYKPLRGEHNRLLRYLWTKLGAHARVIPYGKPDLHQMNVYGSTLYVTAPSWNEIWILDLDLESTRRIRIQPYIRDYHHINNVFCDGRQFYVCLNRYERLGGAGGYIKFDQEWNEIERRTLGWESHALAVIDGRLMQLCCSSESLADAIRHPRRAGLMMNDRFVFEYDPRRYFCKDFSMDDDYLYIVGGENTSRAQRAEGKGVVFVLTRDYQLVNTCVLPGVGGINGCRLQGLDYTNGTPSFRMTEEARNGSHAPLTCQV